MNEPSVKRPVVLFMGSYGREDRSLSDAQKTRADSTAYELGLALVELDIDLAVGGRFNMAASLLDGAAAGCRERNLRLRDRLTTYYAEQWPPSDKAAAAQMIPIEDGDNFWVRILQKVEALVAISGRENTRSVIECAQILEKPVFPIGTIDGAARDTWSKLSSPDLQFLGDVALPPKEMARQLAVRIAQVLAKTAQNSRPASADHVVVLIHGIRDFALWQTEIRQTLRQAGLPAVLTNYGRFDLFRFLIPVPFFRNAAIEKVWNQIEQVRHAHPDAKLSIIAHSFGTYVTANLIQRKFVLKVHRVIFCGSVLPYDFPFEQVSDRFCGPILNEVGTRDVWPALAESGTFGYGSAGTYGFRRPGVHDRWHIGANHSTFLNRQFCSTYWLPFLQHGTITEDDKAPEPPRLWLQLLTIAPLKYVVPLLLIVATWAYLYIAPAPAAFCIEVRDPSSNRMRLDCKAVKAASAAELNATLAQFRQKMDDISDAKERYLIRYLAEYRVAKQSGDTATAQATWKQAKVEAERLMKIAEGVRALVTSHPQLMGGEHKEAKLRIAANAGAQAVAMQRIVDATDPETERVEEWETKMKDLGSKLAADLNVIR